MRAQVSLTERTNLTSKETSRLLGILATIALLALLVSENPYRTKKSEPHHYDSICNRNLSWIGEGCRRFKKEHGQYPSDLANLSTLDGWGALPRCPVKNANYASHIKDGVFEIWCPTAKAMYEAKEPASFYLYDSNDGIHLVGKN